MNKYLLIEYFTFNGIRKFIDLGDSAYGQWIIYDHSTPKYFVNTFDLNTGTNLLIRKLIEDKKETIESIIIKLNENNNLNLSLGQRPLVQIVKESSYIELELNSLPENWFKNI